MINNTLLDEIQHTAIPYSQNKTIMELFEDQVKLDPTRIALHIGERTVSYAELNAHANQLASFLRKKGAHANRIIGIDIKRSYEMIVSIFAILKSGAAYLPIDSDNPLARKQKIIADSQMNFLLIENSSQTYTTGANCDFVFLNDEKIVAEDPQNLPKITLPNDLAYVIYTSGSTGTPKGVMIEHHALVNRIEWMQSEFPIYGNDVLLQKTHYSFDVSVWEILWWCVTGASLVLLPAHQEHEVRLQAKLISRHNITVIHFVPSVLRIFLSYIETDFDLSKLKSLRYVFSSGEALDAGLVNRFNVLTLAAILINLYGPTEATIDVTYFICHKNHEYNIIPIGKAINNIQPFVLDENYKKLPTDVAGELYISGVGLARGYLNQSELSVERFIPNPYLPGKLMYKTGDRVKWDSDANLIYLGRTDDQIKLRGLRLDLNEIKYYLLQQKNIEDAVVICHENNFQQTLLAFIKPKKNLHIQLNPSEIKSLLGRELPHYMLPSAFIPLENFPLKANGKINKEKILAEYINLQSPQAEIQSRLLALHEKAQALWQTSFNYSQERMIRGKPIARIPVIQDKLENAKAMIQIFKAALDNNTDINSLIRFAKNILADTLENLLFIHGASGYMQQNSSTKIWLECREILNFLCLIRAGNDQKVN